MRRTPSRDEILGFRLGRAPFVLLEGGHEIQADRHQLKRQEEAEQFVRGDQEHHAHGRPQERGRSIRPSLRRTTRTSTTRGLNPSMSTRTMLNVSVSRSSERIPKRDSVRKTHIVDSREVQGLREVVEIEPNDERKEGRAPSARTIPSKVRQAGSLLTPRRGPGTEDRLVGHQHQQSPERENHLGARAWKSRRSRDGTALGGIGYDPWWRSIRCGA